MLIGDKYPELTGDAGEEKWGFILFAEGLAQNKPVLIEAQHARSLGIIGDDAAVAGFIRQQAIDLFLKGYTSSKNAAFNKLSHYLTSCVYNLDTCRYWLSEYHLDVYRNTGDKSALTEAKKHLLAAITGGCCEHFRVKLKEVENLLSL